MYKKFYYLSGCSLLINYKKGLIMLKRISVKQIIFICLTFIFFAGCSSKNRITYMNELNITNGNKYTIALVADSQFQDENTSKYVPFFKDSFIDSKFVDVSIRVPAQNLLAKNSLRSLIDKTLIKTNPDMILYLGDGANNGCKDEVGELFSVLAEYQKKEKAIFFIIGNHDYLGAGNTSRILPRNALCTKDNTLNLTKINNNVLTKYDLIKLSHEFNSKSALLIKEKGFKYVDNYNNNLVNECNSGGVFQHSVESCFYSAYITNNNMELFLLDSSNYNDLMTKEAIIINELAGIWGNISKNQWEWFTKNRKTTDQLELSIFASHYPPKNLSIFHLVSETRRIASTDRYINDRKGKMKHNEKIDPLFNLISKTLTKRYWLSAHTHVPEFNTTIQKNYITRYNQPSKKRKYFRIGFNSINVGSTTDYSQHMSYINFNNITTVTKVPLVSKEETNFCKNIINKVDLFTTKNKLLKVNGNHDGLGILGLKKEYNEWEENDYINADKNLKYIISELRLEKEALNCLANYAAKDEFLGKNHDVNINSSINTK